MKDTKEVASLKKINKVFVEKKEPAVKKRVVAKKKPILISYSIKMVIPTVAYGNVQPEIIVKANSVEEAHDFIVPHMNKLWKEYYLVDGKRPVEEPKPVAKPFIPPTPPSVGPTIVTTPLTTEKKELIEQVWGTSQGAEAISGDNVITQPPASSVAFIKASQAISSCLSVDAFNIISERVQDSIKLTDSDKQSLLPILESRYKELNAE